MKSFIKFMYFFSVLFIVSGCLSFQLNSLKKNVEKNPDSDEPKVKLIKYYYENKNYKEAYETAELLRSKDGISLGLYYQGVIEYDGKIAAADKVKGLRYLKRAMDLGGYNAARQIGLLHYNGDGVKKDLVEAYKYFLIALNLNSRVNENFRSVPLDRDEYEKLRDFMQEMTATMKFEALEPAVAQAKRWIYDNNHSKVPRDVASEFFKIAIFNRYEMKASLVKMAPAKN